MLTGSYNTQNGNITVVVEDTVYFVSRDHENYSLLLKAFKDNDEGLFLKLYTSEIKKEDILIPKAISGTGVDFQNGVLTYNGKVVHHSYAKRIVEAYQEGFSIDPMLKFFENLMKNPSHRSIEELPDFLMNRNLPITEDGYFLAYKSVNSQFYSKASGTLTLLQGTSKDGRIYNGVGEVIECSRNEVDDERVHECSHGLHVGGLAYSGPGGTYNSYSDIVVICKINPMDVVSVPRDHNAQKVRICKYEVLSEYQEPLNSSHVGVEKKEYVLVPEDLSYLDLVSFEYMGANDNDYMTRYMVVEEIAEDHLFGTLLADDPSFEEGNESRKFLIKNIKEGSLKMVNNDSYFE